MRHDQTILRHVIAILCVVWFAMPSVLHAQNVDDLLRLIGEGKIDTATTILEDLSLSQPGNPGVRYARALMQTDALLAAGIYKDIIRNHETSKYYPGSLMRLGEFYYAQGLYVQSRQHLNRLIKFHPDSPNIVNAVNLSLRAGIASRQMDSVYIDLAEIVRLYPDGKFDLPEELDVTRIHDQNRMVPPAQPMAAPIRTLGEDIKETNSNPRGALSLQAGAFGSYDNAKRLADQIESIGYSTRIKERDSNGRTLYLILVGDFDDRTAAMSVSDILEAALGVDSFPVAND